MVQSKPFPDPAQLGVASQTYLNGIGEAASELRRYLLDRLRQGEVAESERLLGVMETVYQDLTTFDFPDSLTGGLRRTCDALRAVVERTRSDVTMTVVQRQLIDRLRLASED
jgi:translin